jgi:ankyrin repeat protein
MKSQNHTALALCVAAALILVGALGWRFQQHSHNGHHPIPNGKNVRTQKDFNAATYRFMMRHTVDAFQKYAAPSASNAEAVHFLKDVCRAVSYPSEVLTYQALAQEGAQLIKNGCNDPLVRLWYGQMLYRLKQYKAAEPYLMGVYAWDKNKYPDIHAFYAFKALASIAERRDELRSDEAAKHMSNALIAFCFAVKEKEFVEGESPLAFRLLDDTESSYQDKFDFVLNCLQQQTDIDAWLLNMFKGLREIELAWKARGTGWAKDVSEEKWKVFAEHLTKAKSFIMKAWLAHPERPEAAVAMMRITRFGHGNVGETVRTWFDRAVQLQMDYPDAYYEMILELLPRWGGSHEEMLDFGHECLATKRFDTDVPLFYLYVMRKIAVETAGNRWRLPFRDAREKEKLEYLFSNLLREPSRKESHTRILAQYAMVKAWEGDYEKARQLLEAAGPDVDLHNGFLHKAISWSDAPMEQVKAELRAFTGPHKNPLIQAEALEIQGRTEAALPLFEKGMEAYRSDGGAYAYLRDRIALLRLGKTAEDSYDSPLAVAARENAVDVAQFLLDHGAALDGKGQDGWRPLHYAASNGNIQVAELLLDKGADPNALDNGHSAPLYYAVKNHHIEMAKLLAAKGADTNAVGIDHSSPLHCALYYGYVDLARWLIENGCDINARGRWGWTPLLYAVKGGHTDIARLLLAKGARVDEKTDQGWTPLQIMTWDGNIDMVKLLLDHGADANIALADGNTALSIARNRKFDAIVRLLESYQPK